MHLAVRACRRRPGRRNTRLRTAATTYRGGGNVRLLSSSSPWVIVSAVGGSAGWLRMLAGVLGEAELGDEFVDFGGAYQWGVGVFGEGYEDVAGMESVVIVGWFVGEGKIFLLVIGSSDIFNRGSGFDADCLLALKEDVDIDVFAVHFERLRVFASGIDNVVINKHVISIKYISAKWELLKVLRIEEIEEKPHFWVER